MLGTGLFQRLQVRILGLFIVAILLFTVLLGGLYQQRMVPELHDLERQYAERSVLQVGNSLFRVPPSPLP